QQAHRRTRAPLRPAVDRAAWTACRAHAPWHAARRTRDTDHFGAEKRFPRGQCAPPRQDHHGGVRGDPRELGTETLCRDSRRGTRCRVHVSRAAFSGRARSYSLRRIHGWHLYRFSRCGDGSAERGAASRADGDHSFGAAAPRIHRWRRARRDHDRDALRCVAFDRGRYAPAATASYDVARVVLLRGADGARRLRARPCAARCRPHARRPEGDADPPRRKRSQPSGTFRRAEIDVLEAADPALLSGGVEAGSQSPFVAKGDRGLATAPTIALVDGYHGAWMPRRSECLT